MPIDFKMLAKDTIRHITPYQPGKPIEELARELGLSTIIKLASNENPLGPSPYAIEAAQAALKKGQLYPDGSYYQLKQKLAAMLAVQPNQITMGNGSDSLFELIIKTYLTPNENAIISEYTFLTISLLLTSFGIPTRVVPTINWAYDIKQIVAAITPETRILFIVNPNNPTGTYLSAENFDWLIRTVPPHVLIVVDEAYAEYCQAADYPKTIDYLKNFPNLIVTRTFSKIYGLAALRIGFAISSPDIADMLNRARLPFNVNMIAAEAALAALDDQKHIETSILLNQTGRQQLTAALAALHLNSIAIEGNFLTVKIPHAVKVYHALLQQGIIVRPLQPYRLSDYLRITIGTPEQNARLLLALKKILGKPL